MNLKVKIVLGLISFLVLLLFTAPARLVEEALPDTGADIQLNGYSGRLLSGQAANLSFKGVSYRNLSWQLHPLSGLTGTLAADLTLADPHAELTTFVQASSQGNWQVAELNGELDIASLQSLASKLKNYRLAGVLKFNAINLGFNDGRYDQASGEIQWQSGVIRVNNMDFSLGEIDAQLSSSDGNLILNFQGSSFVRPNGSVKLSPTGEYEMILNIDPAQLPADASMLVRFGRQSANGQVQFQMKGRLKP